MSPRAEIAAFHEALQDVLDKHRTGALLTRFVLTLEVSEGGDGGQTLMHRSGELGGGPVSPWAGFGMAGATFETWRGQLLDTTDPPGDPE